MGDYELVQAQCSQSNETLARVQLLFSYHIIAWPNVSHCLPHCGMCQMFASDPTYNVFNLFLIGFLLPLVGFCGLIGNGLSAFIYSRQEMRSSTNLYLCALGCSDSAVICTAIFLFCIDSIRRYSLHLSVLFGALSPLVYPAGMTAQTCSVYFTLVAGVDCFVTTCLPQSCRQFVSRPIFVKSTVFSVLVFSVLYNIPHCFEAVVLECWHINFHSRSLEVCPDPFRFLPTYMLIYYKYMYSVFLAVGPLVVLVLLNLCIIVVSVCMKTDSGGSSGDTIALVLVVLLFIACNVAALLLNVFEARLAELLGPKINYVVDASNLLVVFNSSFNFVIYVTFSTAFRATLLQYVRKAKRSPYQMHTTTDDCKQPNNPVIAGCNDHANSNHGLIARKHTVGRLPTLSQHEVLI